MTDAWTRSSGTEDEDATVRLLRVAGPRTAVSPDRAARVRSAVRLEWQNRRRRTVLTSVARAAGLAAAVALMAFAGRAARLDRGVTQLGEPIAVVETVAGASELRRTAVIRAGQWVETGPEARVAMRFGDTSVRLDLDSRMQAVSSRIIELSSGALYIDTGLTHERVEIRTPFGTVRNVGTQFEVRLVERSLRLRVRTGVVEFSDRTRSISGQPGTEIMLSAERAVTRPIALDSPEWAWVTGLAPAIEMDGVSLAVFLARMAREQGWTVEYPEVAVARQAETIILHGSARDLAPREAVEVAIVSSGFRHRFAGGSVIVVGAEAPPHTDRRGEGQ